MRFNPRSLTARATALIFTVTLALPACAAAPGGGTALGDDDLLWIALLALPRGLPRDVADRALFLVGGVGENARLVAQLDAYDPLTGQWYAGLTQLPTPRAFAQVAALNRRIFVFGGVDSQGTVVTSVEEYDPDTNVWATRADMPQRLQGAVVGAVGSSAYFVAGTTTTAMQTGTLFNQVYRFTPETNGPGTWATLVSGSAIAANVDAGGCALDGVLYFAAGRFYNDGSAQFANDGYVVSSNTTTALAEASYTQARHGAAAACYRPTASDPAPTDPPAVFLIGGSTLGNTAQPASAILASAVVDYYRTGGPNAMTALTNLPAATYYAGAGVSYPLRRLFVFGGAPAVNLPGRAVYSLDLSNPTGQAWRTEATQLPTPRYGHRVVQLTR